MSKKADKKPLTKDQYGSPLESDKGSAKSIVPLANTGTSRLLTNPNLRPNILSHIVRTPAPNTNRYTPLQYINTLVGPRDFDKPAPSSRLANTQTFQTNTDTDPDYIKKENTLSVIIAEKHWLKLPPVDLANKIFPKDLPYPCPDIHKTRIFYEYILIDTNSIELVHNEDNDGVVQFSKLKILKVLSDIDWGQPLHKPKRFTRSFVPQEYNYYDYVTAWNNVLYLKTDKHSWFLWFKKGISLKFPKWFIRWFFNFGPMREVFPPEVEDLYKFFKDNTTFVDGYKFLSFIASQGITWIMSWTYTYDKADNVTDLYFLSRQVKIKWWKKFDVRLINKEKILQWARNNRVPRSQLDIDIDKEALFLAQKSQIMAELATATSQEEFEDKLQRMKGISQDQKSIKDEGSSSSTNPYHKNRDMLDYFTKEEFSE